MTIVDITSTIVSAARPVYSSAQLIALCPRTSRAPPPSTCDILRRLDLWAPCRLLGRRLALRRGRQAGRRHHVHQHYVEIPTTPTLSSATVSFGCLNIRSIASKLDDLLELRRDRAVDVFCLVETWHDPDSVAFRRLRADGFSVVDRPRPRSASANLSPNHGGVAIVSVPGVHLAPVPIP
jgi:hypothetical protein